MKSKINKIITLTVLVFLIGTVSYAEIATDAKLQYNKGIDYYQLGQFDEAANCFRRAVDLDPNYIDAYYNLGSILEYLKQDEAALAVFKQIILRKPTDYESVYRAAEISRKLGDFQKAKMYLTIIPQDSLIGNRAKQLSDKLDVEIEQEQKNAVQEQSEALAQKTATENPSTTKTFVQKAQSETKPAQQLSYGQINPDNNTNGTYGNIPSPTGIAVDNNGNIFVAGFSDNTIFKIGPDNNMIVYLKSEKINGPIGIALDTDSNLYIANYNKNNVIKVDSNGSITELLTNVINPYCMYIKDNFLFVSSQGTNSVLRYKLK